MKKRFRAMYKGKRYFIEGADSMRDAKQKLYNILYKSNKRTKINDIHNVMVDSKEVLESHIRSL